jgi:hypothetical protein
MIVVRPGKINIGWGDLLHPPSNFGTVDFSSGSYPDFIDLAAAMLINSA